MVSITATAENNNYRTRINITGGDGLATVYITSYNTINSSPRALRSAAPVRLVAGQATVYDYEAIRDVPTTYRVNNDSGSEATATLSSLNKTRLISPSSPELSMNIKVFEYESLNHPTNVTIHKPIGARTPIAVSQVLTAPEADLTILCADTAESKALFTLLKTGETLLLSNPTGWDDHKYVAFSSVNEKRINSHIPQDGGRLFELSFTEVAEPSALGTQEWTYAVLARRYVSYADVLTNYATYADLKADNVAA